MKQEGYVITGEIPVGKYQALLIHEKLEESANPRHYAEIFKSEGFTVVNRYTDASGIEWVTLRSILTCRQVNVTAKDYEDYFTST